MRLIERDDFNDLDPNPLAFNLTLNEDGQQDPGPFLFCVNDQGAWVGRHVVGPAEGYEAFHVLPIDTATVKKDHRWYKAADLWLRDADITRAQMLLRYASLTRRLRRIGPRTWTAWGKVYTWNEGSDIMWDGLAVHPFIERRERDGRREVVDMGTGADKRYRERQG